MPRKVAGSGLTPGVSAVPGLFSGEWGQWAGDRLCTRTLNKVGGSPPPFLR